MKLQNQKQSDFINDDSATTSSKEDGDSLFSGDHDMGVTPSSTSSSVSSVASNIAFSDDMSEEQVLESGRVQVEHQPTVQNNLQREEEEEESSREAGEDFEEISAADIERRNQAFEVFKKLENLYRQLYARIIDEKERDLDRVETDINQGTHKGLKRDVELLDQQLQRCMKVAEQKRKLALDAINTEFEETLAGSHKSFLEQKLNLRRRLLEKCNKSIHKLVHESQEKTVPQKPITRRPPQYYYQGRVRMVPYPILEQYHWRRRETHAALIAYYSKMDDFGCQLPPKHQPMALYPQEADLDIEMIRQGLPKPEENIQISIHGDKESIQHKVTVKIHSSMN